MVTTNISIAIDGPAGAGKSTIAKKVAENLSIEYIDTGSMYRALTLKVIQNGLNPENTNDVIRVMNDTDIDFKDNSIYLDGIKVDEQIRENIINNNVSFIAKIKEVREGMVNIQQKLSNCKSVIMDGRDIGTVVLPNADFKFFLTATSDIRAIRRHKELTEKGEVNITIQQIKEEIENRDIIDSTREIAPLRESEDSYRIDTTDKTIDECVEEIISIVKGGNWLLFYNSLKSIAGVLLRLVYRIQVIGKDKIPKEGKLILCSNHIHNLDPIMISIVVPRQISWMGKKELFGNKIMASFLGALGVFPVDRNEPDLSTIKNSIRILKEEGVLGIFPEGTRVKEMNLENAKPGIALIGVKAKSPVLPIYIEGSYKFFSKVKIYIGDPIDFTQSHDKKLSTEEYGLYSQNILKSIYSIKSTQEE